MTEKKKRLVLLDAHAIIHRAYHALPEFASSKGEPTGALYGLSSMLMKIIQDLSPDYLIACYDVPEPTQRHEVYEEYKAGRAKTDDKLIAQLKRSHDVFKAFCIPIYEKAGFEADDIIGTVVEKTKGEENLEVIIASGDLDTLQLISGDRVRVYTLKRGLSDTIIYDEEKVEERFGFAPILLLDYKGLRGDPSDNIPGVKGVGDKTATDLIQTFGTIEKIYTVLKKDREQLEKKGVKPRVVRLLEEGEDDAAFSKMLATIRTDAPISFKIPERAWKETLNIDELLRLFDELEFRTLGDRATRLFGTTTPHLGAKLPNGGEEYGEIDERELKETSIALWLLSSDITTPTPEDILRFAHERDLKTARERIFKDLKKTGRLMPVFETIEKPLIPVIEEMERCGIELDTRALGKLSKKMHKELERIRARIFKHAGHEFNVNSPKQLGGVLFDELGIKTARQKRTDTGQRSTRESELEKMRDQHPIVGEVQVYRELQKLLSTYIDNLPELVEKDGRLHAQFLQAGTTTGRMASQNPNLQNIPIRGKYGRDIRAAFKAGSGYLLASLDYSQIELRIAASLSEDEKLIDVFKQKADVHTAVAARVFGVAEGEVSVEMRQKAKVINFGILYGMGVNALRVNLGEGVSRNEAQEFLNSYFNTFPGLAQYIESSKAEAARKGYTETLFGRRRYFEGFSSNLPYVRAQAERMAINAPIQGTQADIIKLAMVRAHEELRKNHKKNDARLLLQVHDELVYEVREEKAKELVEEIRGIMESIVSPKELRGVPLVVSVAVGRNWGEMGEEAKREVEEVREE